MRNGFQSRLLYARRYGEATALPQTTILWILALLIMVSFILLALRAFSHRASAGLTEARSSPSDTVLVSDLR